MSVNVFRAVASHITKAAHHALIADEHHYSLFVNGHRYTIGKLKRDQHGRWLTYCGGRRSIDFCDLAHDETYVSAEAALKAFRGRYEAAEAAIEAQRALFFDKIAEAPMPVFEPENHWTPERLAEVKVVLRAFYDRRDGVAGGIGGFEIECTPQQAVAFLLCPDTNVSVEGYRVPSKRDGNQMDCFTDWKRSYGSTDQKGTLYLRNLGHSHYGHLHSDLLAA